MTQRAMPVGVSAPARFNHARWKDKRLDKRQSPGPRGWGLSKKTITASLKKNVTETQRRTDSTHGCPAAVGSLKQVLMCWSTKVNSGTVSTGQRNMTLHRPLRKYNGKSKFLTRKCIIPYSILHYLVK